MIIAVFFMTVIFFTDFLVRALERGWPRLRRWVVNLISITTPVALIALAALIAEHEVFFR
jgi:hypothetical protein